MLSLFTFNLWYHSQFKRANCALWVRGMACYLSTSVNHSNTTQSWMSSCIWKWVVSAFLQVCSAALWHNWTTVQKNVMGGFMCLIGSKWYPSPSPVGKYLVIGESWLVIENWKRTKKERKKRKNGGKKHNSVVEFSSVSLGCFLNIFWISSFLCIVPVLWVCSRSKPADFIIEKW